MNGYDDENYQMLNTDPEIIYAIEFLFGPFRFNEDGECIENKAWKVWYDPSQEQTQKVEKLAWSVITENKDVLCWGDNEIERP